MEIFPKTFQFSTSIEAWKGINRYLIQKEQDVIDRKGFRTGSQIVSYDNTLLIRKAYMPEDFDFNLYFNYHRQKWSSLVNNYVDLNHLDMVRSEVLLREKKNAGQYNISFIFDNSHNSGKGCLLSMTFIRRANFPIPIISAVMRSSEVVKRLPFDLLLLQRLGEYTYGKNADFAIQLILPNIYTQTESSTMYLQYDQTLLKHLMAERKRKEPMGPFCTKLLDCYESYLSVDPASIKYKIHLRAVKALQKEAGTGKPLLVKDLQLQ